MTSKSHRSLICLLGNYPPDSQQSMERFMQMLKRGFEDAGLDVKVIRPFVFFGRLSKQTTNGISKWLGYIDKWVLFRLWLVLWLRWHKSTRFHVCDHSNAPYLPCLPRERVSITCHDVLAIRGALGYEDAYCRPSKFGVFLQKWICNHLLKCKKIACVSHLTKDQLLNLLGDKPEFADADWRVIHNALNNVFKIGNSKKSEERLASIGITSSMKYILHVGSNLPRKNRRMLLEMVSLAGAAWDGYICFAGTKMDGKLRKEAEQLGLADRIIECHRPDHQTLVSLYAYAHSVVFPSFSEGFGWPVAEAQACGTPVIASDTEPMPEVSGGAALHADPLDPAAFTTCLLKLEDGDLRQALIEQGYENKKRFTLNIMVESYIDLIDGK